jgi:hypothetical protein
MRALNKLERAIAMLDVARDSLGDYGRLLRPSDADGAVLHEVINALDDIVAQLELIEAP